MGDEIEIAGGQTAAEAVPDHRIAGIDDNWSNADAEWEGDDYAATHIPDEQKRPKWEWGTDERRAYLYAQLREAGHPDNIEQTYEEYGDEFGISKVSIWRDFNKIREYIRFHAGSKAVSNTETLVDKAVRMELDNGNGYKALQAQLDYNEWLFELGRLDREPDRKQIESVSVSADAGGLDDSEREHFEELADRLANGGGEIHVEATEAGLDDAGIDGAEDGET